MKTCGFMCLTLVGERKRLLTCFLFHSCWICLRITMKYTNECRVHCTGFITALTTPALLPSCFLSAQEVASASRVRGRLCEVVPCQREGTGGHSLPLCHPGAWGLGRDGRPHQGHQRANSGGAEEDGVGGAGPPVDTCSCKQARCSWALLHIIVFMLRFKDVHVDTDTDLK